MSAVAKLALAVAAVAMFGPLLFKGASHSWASEQWHRADSSSAGLAPDPRTTPEAVVQVYAAPTYGWRGVFAVLRWGGLLCSTLRGGQIFFGDGLDRGLDGGLFVLLGVGGRSAPFPSAGGGVIVATHGLDELVDAEHTVAVLVAAPQEVLDFFL